MVGRYIGNLIALPFLALLGAFMLVAPRVSHRKSLKVRGRYSHLLKSVKIDERIVCQESEFDGLTKAMRDYAKSKTGMWGRCSKRNNEFVVWMEKRMV